MELKNIKEFIELFVKKEYEFNYGEYDMEVSDIQCEKIAEKVNDFLYYAEYERVTGVLNRKGNEEWEKRYKMKLEKIIPRILFQIKHYEDPTLGDALKRIVTGNDLYACYVSYDLNVGRNPFFSSIFYVSETNQGLKIIYRKLFDDEKGKWYHSHDLEAAQIINSGKLIEVQKYVAPEEPTSLADYNAE